MTDLLTIRTEIEVAAPPLHVWATLIDFPAYPEWNPYLVRVEGAAVAGTTLIVHAEARRGEPALVQPIELVSLDYPAMRWEGGLPDRSQFKGDHWWTLAPDRDGTTLVHQFEHFSGALAASLLAQHGDAIRANFERFNLALKSRVERLA